MFFVISFTFVHENEVKNHQQEHNLRIPLHLIIILVPISGSSFTSRFSESISHITWGYQYTLRSVPDEPQTDNYVPYVVSEKQYHSSIKMQGECYVLTLLS